MRVIVDPLENNPPLLIHPDRVKLLQVAAQLLQTIRGWHPEIVQSCRRMERLELPFRPARHPMKFPYDRVVEEPFGALVSKGFDHAGNYTGYRDTVKVVRVTGSRMDPLNGLRGRRCH